MSNPFVLTAACATLALAACTMTANVADDRTTVAASGNAGMPVTTSVVSAGQGGVVIVTLPTLGGANANWFGRTRELEPSEVTNFEQSACNANSVLPESPGTKIEIVVDASSSMESPAPGSDHSKWDVTREVLLEVVSGGKGAGLPANTAVGIVPFPNMSVASVGSKPTDLGACLNTNAAVPLALLGDTDVTSHRSQMRQTLNEVTLGRGSPTVDAFKWALNKQLLPQQQAFPGDSYMLLLTDGMPTIDEGCSNTSGSSTAIKGDSVVAAVNGAYQSNVKTFVIGIPGSEEKVSVLGASKKEDARLWLSNAAFFGDTPIERCDPNSDQGPYCHMDLSAAADYAAALEAALGHVVSTILACKFAVPTKSLDGTRDVDTKKIAPLIRFGDGTTRVLGLVATASADCSNGFRQINDTLLELCGDTCREYRSDPNASLRILVGCTVEDVDPPPSGI